MMLSAASTPSEAELFKNEFKEILERTSDDKGRLEAQLQEAVEGIKALRETSFSWRSIADQAQRVQEMMLDKDPVALKNAYRSLFRSVVVSAEDAMGIRVITYVLNDPEITEDEVRFSSNLVETVVGIKRPIIAAT